MSAPDDLETAIDKLARFGSARNRTTDREVRYVTLTDDEALAVLERIDATHRWRGWLDDEEGVWCERCSAEFYQANGQPCPGGVLR